MRRPRRRRRRTDAAMLSTYSRLARLPKKKAIISARSELTKVSSNAIPKTRLPRKRFIVPLNCRNKSTTTLRPRRHFQWLVEKYPGSPHFEEAIEAQFRIGEIYLNGKKLKFLGIPIASALDRAVTVFANVVRTAPYGKYTARAQFDIGLAREKQGANDAAIQAYQAVVDKFPN